MTKWKCINEDCGGNCEIYTEKDPLNCILDDECAEWEEVTEEYQKQDETFYFCDEVEDAKEKIEQVMTERDEPVTDCNQLATNCIQLPDWCKVGKWVYVPEIKEYFKITDIQGENLIDEHGDHLPYKDCVQARLRQFILDEMKALVGKLFKDTDDNIFLATSYLCHRGGLLIGGYYYNAGELLDSSLTIDSKPCGVFEHLEDGEWRA